MSQHRAMLRLVPDLPEEGPDVHFCGHCGAPPPNALAARSRVCALCGLGVVLSASEDVAPRAGEPFLVVDGSLAVCALSRDAEALVGVDEPEAIHRPIGEFFEPADAEAAKGDELVQAIMAVAGGRRRGHTLFVRPVGEYGVRFAMRLGRCGPSTAALLVFPAAVA
jgi:PAS domain-containing protein